MSDGIDPRQGRFGRSRFVILHDEYALKFPRRDDAARFEAGVAANQREAERWQSKPELRRILCPVLFASPTFDLLVMRRAAPMPPEIFDPVEAYKLVFGATSFVDCEFKAEGWGILDGRWVVIDYDNLTRAERKSRAGEGDQQRTSFAKGAAMPEIATAIAVPVVSAIGTLRGLVKVHHDVWKWDEQDVQVDDDWLGFAVRAGRLEGVLADYTWVSRPSALAAELKGTHSRVQAVDVDKRVRYRILHGSFPDVNVLMKKTGRIV